MYLHQVQLDDLIADLPKAIRQDNSISVEEPVVLISTLGFEDRTSAVAKAVASECHHRDGTLVLITYPTNTADNEKHRREFAKAAEQIGALREVPYRHESFRDQLDGILDEVLPSGGRVILDISTCSSYVLYPTLHRLIARDVRVELVYAEAGRYYPLHDEWDEVARKAAAEQQLFAEAFEDASWLSVGLDDVYPYSPFYEYSSGNRPSTLVVVPNFNPARVSGVVRKAEELGNAPQDLARWIIGHPPEVDNEWRMEALKQTNALDGVDSSRLLQASTLEYVDIMVELEDVWQETKLESQMSIACLGSKMQHVGVALFTIVHKEITLWLSEPHEFRGSRYSDGVGPLWRLSLGDTIALREKLASYGQFKWGTSP